MKKTVPIICSLALVLGTVAPTTTLAKQQLAVQSSSQQQVLELTLDKVLAEALGSDKNLIYLIYQADILKLQKKLTEENIDDLNSKTKMPNLDWKDYYESTLAQLIAENNNKGDDEKLDQEKLEEQAETIARVLVETNKMNYILLQKSNDQQVEQQRLQLEEALKQLSTEIEKSGLQRQEAKESVRLMMVGRYDEIISLEKSLQLKTTAITLAKSDYHRLKTRHKLGLSSKQELTAKEREIEKKELELELGKQQYDLGVKKLLLDLNLDLARDVSFASLPTDDLPYISERKPVSTLIQNSYQIKNLEEDYRLKRGTDLSDKSTTEVDIHDLELSLLLKKIRETEKEVEAKIMNLYFELEKAYETMKDKEKTLEFETENFQNLTKRQKVGLVSKFDVEQANMVVKQAEFDLMTAENAYYMMIKQHEALEKGFIQ